MSTLSSSSTYTQVKDSYDDSSSYAEDASVSKAKAFVTACRILLRRSATLSQQADSSTQWDVRLIREELKDAQAYVAANDTIAETVKHASFTELR